MNKEAIRLQAKDETTAPDVLIELASNEDKLTRKYVARNPNTPIETLDRLSVEFADEIVDNPIFDLLLLEDPNNIFVKLCWARSSKTPPETFERLINDSEIEVKIAIAKNPYTTVDILETLATQKKQNMRLLQTIAEHPHISPKITELLFNSKDTNISNISSYDIYLSLLYNPKLTSKSLEYLAINIRHGFDNLKKSILQNTNITPTIKEIVAFRDGSLTTSNHILEKLANAKKFYVRGLVAQYPNTPKKILIKLTKDPSSFVRIDIAMRRDISLEIAEVLADDKYNHVRRKLAKNSYTPKEIVKKLSQDKDSYVHEGVSQNRNIAPEILVELSNSKNHNVRKGVAENRNTPLEILEKFKTDESEQVRIRASTHPKQKIIWLRGRLLTWGETNLRHYPWRNTSDPYHIVVAEFLLQKTDADTVATVYQSFLNRYPTLISLATADKSAISELLQPSGLLFRAQRLSETAQIILEKYQGKIPSQEKELLKLPGINKHIARAICSKAFQQPVAVIDIKVARILERFFGIKREKVKLRWKILWAAADEIAPPSGVGHWNLILLDFVALVCTARNPKCSQCPLTKKCSWLSKR